MSKYIPDRTTVAGICAVLTVLISIATAYGLDLNISESTIVEIGTLIAILFTAAGNMLARSNNVSDQQAGARPEPEPAAMGPMGLTGATGETGPRGPRGPAAPTETTVPKGP